MLSANGNANRISSIIEDNSIIGFLLHQVKSIAIAYGQIMLLLLSICLVLEARPAKVGESSQISAKPSLQSTDPSKPFGGQVEPHKARSHELELSSGQYVKLNIIAPGRHMLVKVIDPKGKEISSQPILNQEDIAFIANSTGKHKLTVELTTSTSRKDEKVSYEIRVIELRPATENDRSIQDAARLHDEAVTLVTDGSFDEAIRPAERAFEVRRKILGSEHRDSISSLTILLRVYIRKQYYDDAALLVEQFSDVVGKTLKPDDSLFIDFLNLAATIYYIKSDYHNAEQLYQKSLAILEGLDKTNQSFVIQQIRIRNNLGLLYYIGT